MFIKLTMMDDSKQFGEGFLNMNKVELFGWDEGLQLTLIWTSGQKENLRAKETPEEIMQLIEEAKNGNNL